MYESFFNLKEKAFNLTPDPDFLYLNKRTRKAFDRILYGIERREGFAVVVGDVGTGKTTLCCALLERIEGERNIRTVLIQNPMLSEVDILRSILQDLGVRPEIAAAKADESQAGGACTREMTKRELIDHLNAFLAERAREDAFTVLIIDESQNLSLDMLEQLRLLSNLETTKKKLLQIIFLGQLELKQKLVHLRQLNQRISVRFETRALSREDTERYIRHRLAIAGGAHRIRFERDAFAAIHRHSKGYPRLINLICDRSLIEAYKERSFTIRKQMVRNAVADLAGEDERLREGRFRLTKAAAAVGLVLIAGSMFLIGKRMDSPRDASERSRLRESTLPVPANRPAELPPDSPKQRPLPAPTEPVQKRGYVLQVHSFRTNEAAEGTAKQLKSMNLPTFVLHHAGKEDDGWYVVYVGPFSNLQDARIADSNLRTSTGASPVLREHAAPEAKKLEPLVH